MAVADRGRVGEAATVEEEDDRERVPVTAPYQDLRRRRRRRRRRRSRRGGGGAVRGANEVAAALDCEDWGSEASSPSRGKGHRWLEIRLFFAGPTLYKMDIVRLVVRCYRLYLGPTLLPIPVVYIAPALMVKEDEGTTLMHRSVSTVP
jgi:hypothetical protein